MAQIDKLRDAANAAQQALYEADAMERDKRNAANVGKCFKYRNSGGGCDERWWLYVKLVRIDDGNMRAFQFQQYPNGHIEIDPDVCIYRGRMGSNDG